MFQIVLVLLVIPNSLLAQEENRELRSDRLMRDSEYIELVEEKEGPDKVLHAEPLYIDLIRDLGARKGEREWNVGFGLNDEDAYEEYEVLIEYEFAPIDRLGLEIELPFTFYTGEPGDPLPSNKLDGIQVAAQYTFLVSKKNSISLALGYLHQFKFVPFMDYGTMPLYVGNEFNPFFVAAKRWGRSFHTLIYSGPVIERIFGSGQSNTQLEINTNLHYMIPGTTNFIGIEFNKEIEEGDFGMTIRPQMRVELSDHILIGLVTGIGVARENERLSMFFRLIYEP
ncbi:MAG: HAEPLYID family protein [Flavobacteriaceae bacterium]